MKTVDRTAPHIDIQEIERKLIGYGLESGYSISLWRLPHQTKVNLLFASTVNQISDLSIEDCKPGFAFANFDPSQTKYFFDADHLFEISENEIVENAQGPLKELARHNFKSTSVPFHKASTESETVSGQLFVDLVKLSINAIETGAFEKVVPSVCRRIDIKDDFDLLNAFNDLTAQYPTALVSLVSDSNLGTWMGASPELLVSTDRNGIFKTVALAGTQPYKENIPLRNVSWTQKEIEEQALVERYIISCFKKIRVREYDEHGPKTVQAGNIIHLKSEFEVDMKAVNFPLLGSVMLKLLHPTSAVCGMPLEASFQFLQQNERYKREFYAGFLGPVNIDAETHLFVNLRCLKWCGNHVYLFAGAGVTIDSEPDMELKEVEIKLETIRKVLGI